MKRRLAIVIAVETYTNSRVKTVNYAEADAKGFAKALENGGPFDKVFLLSGKATRTTITSQVRQNVKTLTKEDELTSSMRAMASQRTGTITLRATILTLMILRTPA